MAHSRARVLCTHWEHAGRVPDPLPGGAHLVTVTRPGETAPGATSFEPAMAAQSDRCEPARVRREDPGSAPLHVRVDGPSEGRADRRQLPPRHPPEHALRRRPAGRRRLLAHRGPGLGLRARVLHARPRHGRDRDLPGGGAHGRALPRAAPGRRRDEPRRDADPAAQPHGARRRGGAPLSGARARGELLRRAAQRRGRHLLPRAAGA